MRDKSFRVNRRQLLAGGLAMAATLPLAPRAQATRTIPLVAKYGKAQIAGLPEPMTDVWCYDGVVPGPLIRYRQGERLRVKFQNQMTQGTTVHWHGLRLPNAMDGVPHVTQPVVEQGESFDYEFELKDAGSFWYHPHIQSTQQIGRGLYGPLIVDEREPVAVDRDEYWMLDDWRMSPEHQVVEDFNDEQDLANAGRIGNTVSINGIIPGSFEVAAGERIRLRLLNTANARYFALRFTGHSPVVVALGGHACEPHSPPEGRVLLGPGMRADLFIDMSGRPGDSFEIIDDAYEKKPYRLLNLVYRPDPPLRENPLDAAMRLPANVVPEPDLANAAREEVILEGGAKGALIAGTLDGNLLSLSELVKRGKYWALNGVLSHQHKMPPLLTFKRGQSVVLEMYNDTYVNHPMHIHGHTFQVLKRDGEPMPYRTWEDTVNVKPRERVEVAFVADNPGDWMFHCHILEHQEAGMMGIVRVE